MPTLPLYESGFVILDGSGNGTVRVNPDEPHARWLPQLVSVRCTSNVNEAQANIYAGPSTADQYFIDGTFSASSGDGSDRISGKIISRTQLPYVWAVFTGGDPGAQATLTVSGTKELPLCPVSPTA